MKKYIAYHRVSTAKQGQRLFDPIQMYNKEKMSKIYSSALLLQI